MTLSASVQNCHTHVLTEEQEDDEAADLSRGPALCVEHPADRVATPRCNRDVHKRVDRIPDAVAAQRRAAAAHTDSGTITVVHLLRVLCAGNPPSCWHVHCNPGERVPPSTHTQTRTDVSVCHSKLHVLEDQFNGCRESCRTVKSNPSRRRPKMGF